MWSSLPQTFQPTLPYNILSGLMLSPNVYLNTSFCLVLLNILCSVHQINLQLIFTARYPSLALSSIPIPSSHLVPPLQFHFSSHIPISHMSQLTTNTTFIRSIYGVRMSSQHLKLDHICNDTISNFIS